MGTYEHGQGIYAYGGHALAWEAYDGHVQMVA